MKLYFEIVKQILETSTVSAFISTMTQLYFIRNKARNILVCKYYRTARERAAPFSFANRNTFIVP